MDALPVFVAYQTGQVPPVRFRMRHWCGYLTSVDVLGVPDFRASPVLVRSLQRRFCFFVGIWVLGRLVGRQLVSLLLLSLNWAAGDPLLGVRFQCTVSGRVLRNPNP